MEICNVIKQQQQDSQSQVPCTQGQELENLSALSHFSSTPQPRSSTPKTSTADTGIKTTNGVSLQVACTSSGASTSKKKTLQEPQNLQLHPLVTKKPVQEPLNLQHPIVL